MTPDEWRQRLRTENNERRDHLFHRTDGRWHDDCRWCLRRREHGGSGIEPLDEDFKPIFIFIRTPGDVARLKRDWQNDPCWDLEDTEGLDKYKDELRIFRTEHEARSERERIASLEAEARALGISGNHAMVERIRAMQYQIDELRRRLDGEP